MIFNLVAKWTETLLRGEVLKIPGESVLKYESVPPRSPHPSGSHASKGSQPWLHTKIIWEIKKNTQGWGPPPGILSPLV